LEILTKNLRENLETASRQALLSKNETINLTVQIETYQQEIATLKDKHLSMTTEHIRTQARVDSLEEDKTRLTSAQRNTQEQVVQGTHKIQHVERQLLASEKDGDELRHQLTREKEQNRRTTRELEILKVAHQATMDVNTRREDQHRSLDRDVDRLNKLIQQYEKEKEMALRDNVSSSSSSSSPTTAATASASAAVTNLQLEEIQSLRDNLRTETKRHQEIDSTNVKTINFGLAYGMGPNKLSDTLNISVDAAKELIEKYFKAFPSIKGFLDKLGNFGKQFGYIKTFPPYNRKRWFDNWYPKIWTNNSSMMELGSIERASKNTPIQGASADMTKRALVLMREYISYNDVPVKLVMTVHDQIDTICREDWLEVWTRDMKHLMEVAAKEIVTNGLLKAEVTVSKCWEK
jgi:hypothetical protein